MNESKLHLLKDRQRFIDNPEYCKTDKGLIEIICRDCDFYKEDDVGLECFAFKILKNMLRKSIITPKEIIDAFE
ncbi:MAG: hypothetical protein ACE5KE_00995 [Methanosarcinales archaeon]